MKFSVAAQAAFVGKSKGFGIKITTPAYELNVFIPARDVTKLNRVPTTPWIDGALRIGKSAGAPTFWSIDKSKQISILVGHDDQTWDFGVWMPLKKFEEILQEIQAVAWEVKES